MSIIIAPGETDAGKRAVEFLLIGTDGMPLAADKTGEQPQISVDGGVFGATGIGVLALVSGNRYLATLTQAVLVEGRTIRTRFADGDTVECWGDTVQVEEFYESGLGGAHAVPITLTIVDQNGDPVVAYPVTIMDATRETG
jgi:hypothetical protein